MATEPTDGEHVARAEPGDVAVAQLTALLTAQAPRLRQRIHAAIPERLRSLLDADDVVQETCTDAFLGFAGFSDDGPDAFASWLWTLARHNLVDAVRLLEAHKRGGRRGAGTARSLDDSRAALADLLLVASVTSPSQWAQRRERAGTVQAAIATLPEPHRIVVDRCDLGGEAVDVVARTLGRTPGAVYLLRHRAHKWLRQRLLDDPSMG